MPRCLWTTVENRRDGRPWSRDDVPGHLAALPDLLDQLGDLVVDLAPLAHEGLDLLHGVDDRGVVTAAELPSDGWVGQVGELPEHVHGHLAGRHQGPLTALPL